MSERDGLERDEARQCIVAACEALTRARASTSPFSRPVPDLEEDGFALLEDASRLFCSSLSRTRGEVELGRWSHALPSMLVQHPERCEEVLEMLERGHLAVSAQADDAGIESA